jgi:hypothetical protein
MSPTRFLCAILLKGFEFASQKKWVIYGYINGGLSFFTDI